MVGTAFDAEANTPRLCLCCGGPRATRSIPACWDHWVVLPEDLRSAIVISYGRGQISRYGDSLMEAVRIWRQAGVWRSKYVKTALPLASRPAPIRSDLATTARVVSFQLRRTKPLPRLSLEPDVGGTFRRGRF